MFEKCSAVNWFGVLNEIWLSIGENPFFFLWTYTLLWIYPAINETLLSELVYYVTEQAD